jgi:hypothetical protein
LLFAHNGASFHKLAGSMSTVAPAANMCESGQPDLQTVSVWKVDGMATINGDDNNNLLPGTTGDDTINGFGGADTLVGDAGNDILDGGSGSDILTGGAGLDTLTGGGDVDIFSDTAAGLNGDRITDFHPGDRIQITDLSIQNANLGISGSSITFNGGSIAVDNLGSGRLVVRAIQNGGVEIRLQSVAHNDFNGDGISDVLWRHESTGNVTDWLGKLNGGFGGNTDAAWNNASLAWTVAGTGDFNGDGRADILWRSASGEVTNWLGRTDGGFTGNIANADNHVDSNWQIVGTGDFNGDGRDDILWQSSDGTVTDWLGQANGSFIGNIANAENHVDSGWTVAGTGDFNGDGRADVLWRNQITGNVTDWLGQANGGFAGNTDAAWNNASLSWHIAGVGDFNGDGRSDILWKNDNGEVTNWLGRPDGGFAGNIANADNHVDGGWGVVEVGDFNGDGFDDVLWQNSDGTVTDWLGQTNGSFAGNLANADNHVDTGWVVQPPELLL